LGADEAAPSKYRNACARHVSSWRDTLRRVANFLRWIGRFLRAVSSTEQEAAGRSTLHTKQV